VKGDYETPGNPRDFFVDEPYLLVADNSSFLVLEGTFLSDIPGDVNGDRHVSVADITYLISYLFKLGAEPSNPETADANCDGEVTVGDVVYLINYLFKSGPSPGC